MKREKEGKYKIFVSMFVVIGIVSEAAFPLVVSGEGDLPYYDIEQDSLGNYHMAYIDNSTGNYEIYYTNDIGGNFSQDWNLPIRITNTTTDSFLLDLGIYLVTDTLFIIWEEYISETHNLTYYTLSGNYGANWTEPQRSYENIMLKFTEFDPLVEEPIVPSLPVGFADPYAYYIVQFNTPTIKDWKDGIRNVGGAFCGYIPKHAFVVWMTPQIKDQVEQLPYVRWIDYYHPSYKIESGLLNRSGIIELNVIIFKEPGGQANLDKANQEIEALGGNITYNGSDNFIIRTQINADRIYDIALIPEVEWIDEWSPPFNYMNNVRPFTGASILHNNIPPFQGQGIIGEVKDNGVDQTHPDYTVAGTQGTVNDEAHGTCTFGTVFASTQNNAMGMLPQATGYFCNQNVGRRDSIQNLVDNWFGVFQSNSWGTNNPLDPYDMDGQYTALSRENDEAVFDFDVTMVYAVGNSDEGVQSPSISRDSAAKNVISVGGIDHNDNAVWGNDDHWNNAGAGQTPSEGPADDGRVKPDLCGPQDYGFVTDSRDGDGENGYRIGNHVTRQAGDELFDGTSFATAVVSGAAGLVYEMYREDHFGNNPAGTIVPQPSTVKALLIANSHQIDVNPIGLNAAQGDGRYQQGWGFVDVGRVFDVGDHHYIINEDIPRQGIVIPTPNWDTHYINVQSDEELRITLAWTDPAAVAGADPALVNDLNLRAVDPDGVVYWGNNGLENAGWSTAGGGPNDWYRPDNPGDPIYQYDNLNNVENILIQNPTEGEWEIRVYGNDINVDAYAPTPEADQTYALVASYHPAKVITLYQGLNVISLPLIQTNPHYQQVFRSIDGYYGRIDIYDNQNKEWGWPSFPNLDHKMGIYIEIINTPQIDFICYGQDITVDQEIELYWVASDPKGKPNGHNLVGYPSGYSNQVADALEPLELGVEIENIWWFNGETKIWDQLQPDDFFELGRGYWFYYNGDVLHPSVTWVVPHERIT